MRHATPALSKRPTKRDNAPSLSMKEQQITCQPARTRLLAILSDQAGCGRRLVRHNWQYLAYICQSRQRTAPSSGEMNLRLR